MNENHWADPGRFVVWGIIAVIVIIAVSSALSFLFFTSRPVPAGYYYFPFFPFGGFFAIFWIFAAFWVVRWLFFPWRWHGSRRYWRYQDESYYILRQRYAKGEITKDQFDQMMRDLEQRTQTI